MTTILRCLRRTIDIIAEAFVDQWPRDILKMKQLLERNNLKVVLNVTHVLKGTLTNFGARIPVELVKQVETWATLGFLTRLNDSTTALMAEVDQLLAALQRAKV